MAQKKQDARRRTTAPGSHCRALWTALPTHERLKRNNVVDCYISTQPLNYLLATRPGHYYHISSVFTSAVVHSSWLKPPSWKDQNYAKIIPFRNPRPRIFHPFARRIKIRRILRGRFRCPREEMRRCREWRFTFMSRYCDVTKFIHRECIGRLEKNSIISMRERESSRDIQFDLK